MKADAGRELLVLGILRRQPLSAYSIDRTVRNHSPLYRRLGQGNVYHLVDRLAEAGYLARRSAKAQRGPASSKTIFHLTGAGETRFQQLLVSVIHDAQAGDPTLEIAFVLLGQVQRARAIRLLEERAQELAQQEKRVKRLFGEIKARSGPAYIAGSHAIHRLQSEQRFLREMLRHLRDSRWHADWVADDGAVEDPKRKL
jgi:DNA-binding PadR family transcriptional regulator